MNFIKFFLYFILFVATIQSTPKNIKRKFHKLTSQDKRLINCVVKQRLIDPLKDIYAISTRSRIG